MARAARPEWAPAGVDLTRPSVARMYDYFLGGSHNFAVDRRLAEQVITVRPEVPLLALANRAFLHRAIRHLTGAGIRQFLDIGSGIPSAENVHEVVRTLAPDARVLYVDVDPVAVAHSRAMLGDDERVGVVQADIRDAEGILDSAATRRMFDLATPVALLLVAILHFVPDVEEPGGALDRLRNAMPAGSQLVITHGLPTSPEVNAKMGALYAQSTTPGVSRDLAGVRGLFGDWELLAPGLVPVTQWRPDPAMDPTESTPAALADAGVVAGVAVKP